jgi:hypothetical protein
MKTFLSGMCWFLLAACAAEDREVGERGLATAGSGTSSVLIGRGAFSGPFRVEREHASGWEVELKSNADLDVAVQTITFQPGGQSGWHSHPGPVLITVMSGTMTFYDGDDPDCQPTIRTGGQGVASPGFLDGAAATAHLARNESGAPATTLVVYLAPKDAPLRIDQPAPGNCPF